MHRFEELRVVSDWNGHRVGVYRIQTQLNENGTVEITWTCMPISLQLRAEDGEGIKPLENYLAQVQEAFKKPILTPADLPEPSCRFAW